MQLTKPGALYGLLAVIIGAFAVIIVAMFTKADAAIITAMVGLIGPCLGYLVGNGTGAARGMVNVSTFAPTVEKQLEVTKSALEEVKRAKDDSGEIMRNG